MSKIFDAYKKRIGEAPDLALEIGKASSISLFPGPNGAQKEEFNRLANRILGLRGGSRGVVLGFASCAPGEGSSFVSYNAASVLAQVYHQKVAWIDANVLSPQKKLRGLDRTSFAELLKDPHLLGDLRTPESLHLIPAGENLLGARGHFADSNFSELMTACTRRFDFTILDLSPILSSTDSALISSGTDGLLLVIQQKHLKREVIEHGIQGVKDKGAQVLGTVINRRTFELPKVIYDRL